MYLSLPEDLRYRDQFRVEEEGRRGFAWQQMTVLFHYLLGKLRRLAVLRLVG